MLVNMSIGVETARLMVQKAAVMRDQGKPFGKEASMAKLYGSNVAVQNALDAVQVYGGNGYSRDYPVERLLRDAKITQIYEGTSEVQKLVIAKHLLK